MEGGGGGREGLKNHFVLQSTGALNHDLSQKRSLGRNMSRNRMAPQKTSRRIIPGHCKHASESQTRASSSLPSSEDTAPSSGAEDQIP